MEEMTIDHLNRLADLARGGTADPLLDLVSVAYVSHYEKIGVQQPFLDKLALQAAVDAVTAIAAGSQQGPDLWAEMERQRDRAFRKWLGELQFDLNHAVAVQRMSFLPEPPETAEFEISAVTHPLGSVGGDLYEFVRADHGILAALIDGAGKGRSAAMLASSAASVFRAVFPRLNSLPDLLFTLHDALRRPDVQQLSVACSLVQIAAEGKITVACAGTDPPLIHGPDGFIRVHASGPLVGSADAPGQRPIQPADFVVESVSLEPGDILAIYSDGITERFGPHDQQFGKGRLAGSIDDSRDRALHVIIERVFADLAQFAGSEPRHDDETLLLIRRRPLTS